MNGQISMFELMGIGTPELLPEEQKKGRRGWIIEITAILLRKNGYKEDATAVCTRPIEFEADTWQRNGEWRQAAKTIHGPQGGWYGGYKTVYAKRPTWEEFCAYARAEDKRNPKKVVYYERTGEWKAIYEYENGYQKEAI